MLYQFQQQALNESEANYLYALDTGTGKTLTALHHYLKYSNGEPLLIVCPPQKLKEGGWDREVKTIESYYNIKISYRALSYGVLSKYRKMFDGYFIIFDEAHYIKNPTSQRGKAAMTMAKASTHFCLLTATPAANGIGDMINYFIMFGFTKNKTQFNYEFGIYETKKYGGRAVNIVTDYKDKQRLMDWYESFTVSINKDDCLDLPGITFEKVTFDKSKEYTKLFNTRVMGGEAYDTPSKLMHGLRYYANRDEKAKYLEEFLESTTNNVVIFYNYTSEFETINEIAKKLNKTIYVVNGKQSTLPAFDTHDQIKNSVTIVQFQAGAAAIELQYCNEVVFYGPTYSYQDYSQALGRAYRNGQKRKVTVYQWSTTGTIEEDIWKSLKNKKDFDKKLYERTKLCLDLKSKT